tara:strand:+ start:1046 stop:1225 length:180 start_codon:yes stop_codon:yes gene_type:complete
MAMNGYIGGRKQKFVYRKANIVDLLKRNKLEEKKEKRNTVLIATATISSLAIVGLIITL